MWLGVRRHERVVLTLLLMPPSPCTRNLTVRSSHFLIYRRKTLSLPPLWGCRGSNAAMEAQCKGGRKTPPSLTLVLLLLKQQHDISCTRVLESCGKMQTPLHHPTMTRAGLRNQEARNNQFRFWCFVKGSSKYNLLYKYSHLRNLP